VLYGEVLDDYSKAILKGKLRLAETVGSKSEMF
jgi:hypothetical protein